MTDLRDRIALVTGAASGIGLEIARHFQSAGARLVLTDVNAEGLEAAAATFDGAPLTLHHDVGNDGDWHAVLAAVERMHGRLDVLVNNAGVMMARPFAEAGIDILRRQLRINVESVYLGMHHTLPLLRRAGGGAAIVNIASIYGRVAGTQYAAYSATKGAVLAMTRAVAIELAGAGIRVNCVLPGPVATNLSADWEPPRDDAGNLVPPDVALAAWTKMIPMGRLGLPRDIAPLVAFLAGDAAGFITGADFVVDGGYTAV